ncbi:hypothetical protein SUGI_0139840 [Cryptomeria japonica]|nr:hypothetical protein SUGI_0139840 [Cryptomeria japonica]
MTRVMIFMLALLLARFLGIFFGLFMSGGDFDGSPLCLDNSRASEQRATFCFLQRSCAMWVDKNKLEPLKCDKIKKNSTIWRILERGGVKPYLERLHGCIYKLSRAFAKGWKKGQVTVYGHNFKLTK